MTTNNGRVAQVGVEAVVSTGTAARAAQVQAEAAVYQPTAGRVAQIGVYAVISDQPAAFTGWFLGGIRVG